MDTRGIPWHTTPTGYIVLGQAVDAVVSVPDGKRCEHVYDARTEQRALYLVPFQLCRQTVRGICTDWGPRLLGAVVDCSDWRDRKTQAAKGLVIEIAAREATRIGIEAYTQGGSGHVRARRWNVYAAPLGRGQ